MSCKTVEYLSFRDIAQRYPGTGTVATWRCRLRRNTGGLRSITRKVGGSVRIAKPDLERYIGGHL